jgi:hypothetical protein
MKRLLLLLLIVCSSARAGAQFDRLDIQYRDVAFISGYASASIYDLAYNDSSSNDVKCVAGKMGLGLVAGLAVAIGHASTENSPIPFNDFIFGGLGGLTCTVIHF